MAKAGGRVDGFWTSAAWYMGGALVLQAFNFGMQLVFPRLMPPNEYGIASNYLFWTALFGLLIGLQMNATLNNALHKYGEDQLDNYERGMLAVYAILAVVLTIPILIARGWWSTTLGLHWAVLLLAIVNGLCFARVNLANARAVATRRARRYLVLTGASTLGSALLGLILVIAMPDHTAWGRMLGYALANLVLVIVLEAKLGIRNRRPEAEKLMFALAISLPLLVHEILFLIATQSNRVFVLRMLGEAQAGVFSFAYTVGSLSVVVATAVNSAWTPWYFAQTKARADAIVIAGARDLLTIFLLALGAVLLVSPELFALVAPPDYAEGSRIVAWFIFIGLAVFFFNMAANTLVYAARTRLLLIGSGISTATNIVLILTLTPRFGLVGAAAASAASTLLLALTALALARWTIRASNLPYRMMLILLGLSTALMGVEQWLADRPGIRWISAALLIIGAAALGLRLRNSRGLGLGRTKDASN